MITQETLNKFMDTKFYLRTGLAELTEYKDSEQVEFKLDENGAYPSILLKRSSDSASNSDYMLLEDIEYVRVDKTNDGEVIQFIKHEGGVEVSTIKLDADTHYLVFRNSAYPDIVQCEMCTIEPSELTLEKDKDYPKLRTELKTEKNDKGAYIIESNVYIKVNALSDESLLISNKFSSLETAYVNFTSMINEANSIKDNVKRFCEGDIKYLIIHDTVYEIKDCMVNGFRVVKLDIYDDEKSEVEFITYSDLFRLEYYCVDENSMIVIDGRIFKDMEDYGSVKGLSPLFNTGERFDECLMNKLYTKYNILTSTFRSLEEEPEGDLLASLQVEVSKAMIICDEISEEIKNGRFAQETVYTFYRGGLYIISSDAINYIAESLTEMGMVGKETDVEETLF